MSNTTSPIITKIIQAIRENKLGDSRVLIKNALQDEASNKDYLFQIGLNCAQNNRLNDAQLIFEELQLLNESDPRILFNLGLLYSMQGEHQSALNAYDLALLVNPSDADSLVNKGSIYNEINNYSAALQSLEAAIAISPSIPEAWLNKGMALNHLDRYEEAIRAYDEAIKLNPAYFEAWSNRSIPQKNLKQYAQACESCDRALSFQPEYSKAWLNKADALQEFEKYEEALSCYEKALMYQPDYYQAWANKAMLFHALKRYEEALISYDMALKYKQDYFEAWSNKGISLLMLKKYEEALSCQEKALSFKQDSPEAWANKAVVLQMLRRYQEASHAYEKALSYSADINWALGDSLHLKLKLGIWQNLDESIEILRAKLLSNQKASTPFSLLSLIDDSVIHLAAAKMNAQEKFPSNSILGVIPKHQKGKKIRIGYFSGDFYEHPVSYLAAELFELHDRDAFEIHAFALKDAPASDQMRKRLINSFDSFMDVSSKSDIEVAKLARELKIDIAVDLSGLTEDSRTGIFSYRAAPIQVNFLGYPGTTGADFIDYIIADEIVIPEYARAYYTEKVAYLPHTYLLDDSSRIPSSRIFTRKDFGLPEEGLVFCCLNNSYKINPKLIQSWARILSKVEGSVLWISDNNSAFRENLLKEFSAFDVNPSRIKFASKLDLMEDHLARISLADLFLDTTPYNAHTTAIDSLKAGVPLVTQLGNAFAGRVAASLLNAIDLPELVTNTPEEYENLILELAFNKQKLNDIKERLCNNRLSSPLFNTPLFTKNIEKLFLRMHERYLKDLAPDNLLVN